MITIADSTVNEGLVPVAPAFARACSAGPSPCGGSPASRGLAGLGDTGLSAACHGQLACTTADALSAKSAVSPSRDPLAWGRPVKFDAKTGREPRWAATVHLTLLNRQWPAHARQVACGRAHLHPSPPALGPRAPGGTRTRTRAPASSDHSAITDHVSPGHGPGPRMCTITIARREPPSGPGPCR